MFSLNNGFSVLILVRFFTAWQLEEGRQAVQISHFVECAQQEVHHHQAHEKVDWEEKQTHSCQNTQLFSSIIRQNNQLEHSTVLETFTNNNAMFTGLILYVQDSSSFYLVQNHKHCLHRVLYKLHR